MTRDYSWKCWSCRWWNSHYPIGDCVYCERNTRIGGMGACRLCLTQGQMVRKQTGFALHLDDANRWGQQLFFANMALHRRRDARANPMVKKLRPKQYKYRPQANGQLALFDLPHDPEIVHQRALAADSELIRYCADVVRDHAARHGWSKRQTNDVIRSLRITQVLQDTPAAKMYATDVLALSRYGGNVGSTLEVLAEAGLLIDDRVSHTERYFAGKTAELPEKMKQELEIWLEVMLGGSGKSPRRKPRDPQTVRIHILGITPIVQRWAAEGHQSLAEITRAQILDALPESGSRRNFAEYGLRSLFTVLKGRKLIFTNPMRGVPVTPVNATVPLPLDTAAVREALNSSNPATALAVAMVVFHALTAKQLHLLKVTDIVDGRLAIDDRDIPLAGPVLVRLSAWLDHRTTRWPGSINPHLFVGMRNAPRLGPIGRQFPWANTTFGPQALREDRILQEIHANGGDIRQVCDLFGLSFSAAMRYTDTVPHPDLRQPHTPVRPTRNPT